MVFNLVLVHLYVLATSYCNRLYKLKGVVIILKRTLVEITEDKSYQLSWVPQFSLFLLV